MFLRAYVSFELLHTQRVKILYVAFLDLLKHYKNIADGILLIINHGYGVNSWFGRNVHILSLIENPGMRTSYLMSSGINFSAEKDCLVCSINSTLALV